MQKSCAASTPHRAGLLRGLTSKPGALAVPRSLRCSSSYNFGRVIGLSTLCSHDAPFHVTCFVACLGRPFVFAPRGARAKPCVPAFLTQSVTWVRAVLGDAAVAAQEQVRGWQELQHTRKSTLCRNLFLTYTLQSIGSPRTVYLPVMAAWIALASSAVPRLPAVASDKPRLLMAI